MPGIFFDAGVIKMNLNAQFSIHDIPNILKRTIIFCVFVIMLPTGICFSAEKNSNVSKEPAEDKLLIEEMMIHYDRVFQDYLKLAKEDMAEFNSTIKPLNDKVYSKSDSVNNYQLVDHLYLKTILDHTLMLDNMMELLYSKMELSFMMIVPEKQDVIKKLREKYKSQTEYEKLLKKIEDFKKSLEESEDKLH